MLRPLPSPLNATLSPLPEAAAALRDNGSGGADFAALMHMQATRQAELRALVPAPGTPANGQPREAPRQPPPTGSPAATANRTADTAPHPSEADRPTEPTASRQPEHQADQENGPRHTQQRKPDSAQDSTPASGTTGADASGRSHNGAGEAGNASTTHWARQRLAGQSAGSAASGAAAGDRSTASTLHPDGSSDDPASSLADAGTTQDNAGSAPAADGQTTLTVLPAVHGLGLTVVPVLGPPSATMAADGVDTTTNAPGMAATAAGRGLAAMGRQAAGAGTPVLADPQASRLTGREAGNDAAGSGVANQAPNRAASTAAVTAGADQAAAAATLSTHADQLRAGRVQPTEPPGLAATVAAAADQAMPSAPADAAAAAAAATLATTQSKAQAAPTGRVARDQTKLLSDKADRTTLRGRVADAGHTDATDPAAGGSAGAATQAAQAARASGASQANPAAALDTANLSTTLQRAPGNSSDATTPATAASTADAASNVGKPPNADGALATNATSAALAQANALLGATAERGATVGPATPGAGSTDTTAAGTALTTRPGQPGGPAGANLAGAENAGAKTATAGDGARNTVTDAAGTGTGTGTGTSTSNANPSASATAMAPWAAADHAAGRPLPTPATAAAQALQMQTESVAGTGPNATPAGMLAPQATPQASSSLAATALADVRVPLPLDHPGFGAALGTQVSVMVRDGVHTARLQLNPAEMGPIVVQIAVDGSAARVDFQADMAGTRAVIEASLPSLAGALQDAGFTLAGGGVSQQHPGRQGQGDPAARPNQLPQPGSQPTESSTLVAANPALRAQRGLIDLVA